MIGDLAIRVIATKPARCPAIWCFAEIELPVERTNWLDAQRCALKLSGFDCFGRDMPKSLERQKHRGPSLCVRGLLEDSFSPALHTGRAAVVCSKDCRSRSLIMFGRIDSEELACDFRLTQLQPANLPVQPGQPFICTRLSISILPHRSCFVCFKCHELLTNELQFVFQVCSLRASARDVVASPRFHL